MVRIEREREVVAGSLEPSYLNRRSAAGWKVHAIEWERQIEGEPPAVSVWAEEPPYGLRIADDCSRLVSDSAEMETLSVMMELLIKDYSVSKVADELNRRGFRTRKGQEWSPIIVFNLLPRLVEVGPRIFSNEEWADRRQHIFRLSWSE
jgi:hypothetical protein